MIDFMVVALSYSWSRKISFAFSNVILGSLSLSNSGHCEACMKICLYSGFIIMICCVIMNYSSDILMWAKTISVRFLMASSSNLSILFTTTLYSSSSKSFKSFLLFSIRSLFKLPMLARECLVIVIINSIKKSNWIPPYSFFLTSPSLSISSKAAFCQSYTSFRGLGDASLALS